MPSAQNQVISPDLSLAVSRNYQFEGWGLTHIRSSSSFSALNLAGLDLASNESLLASDGSSTLYEISPVSLSLIRKIPITVAKYKSAGSKEIIYAPVTNINELEAVDGRIYANIWQTDSVAVIQLSTGRVVAWLDFSSLHALVKKYRNIDVLNGIACHPTRRTLFVTGKFWPLMFEVSISDLKF